MLFDINQTAGREQALHFSHSFADFLPSFWAKESLRALDHLFSSVRFLLRDPDRRLIFINIRASTPRYVAGVGRWRMSGSAR
jgi:hypothetical protein